MPLMSGSRLAPGGQEETLRKGSLAGGYGLLVEPDVFHAPAVVDAVDRNRQVFDLGVPTDTAAIEIDQRSSAVLGQPPFDLPDQLLTLLLVRLHRLPVDQLVDLRVAVPVVITDAAAGVVLVKQRIGVVD